MENEAEKQNYQRKWKSTVTFQLKILTKHLCLRYKYYSMLCTNIHTINISNMNSFTLFGFGARRLNIFFFSLFRKGIRYRYHLLQPEDIIRYLQKGFALMFSQLESAKVQPK